MLTLRVCSLGIILGPVLLRMHTKLVLSRCAEVGCKAKIFLQNLPEAFNSPTFAGESRTELEIPLTFCERSHTIFEVLQTGYGFR